MTGSVKSLAVRGVIKKMSSVKASPNAKAGGRSVAGTGKEKKAWNDMSHLSIKRFQDDDPSLTAGARRNRAATPYVAVAEMDPSGRSTCKLCGSHIPKGVLRFGLMMECHKGFRNLCTLHEACLWEHPETKKLDFDDIFFRPNVDKNKKSALQAEFAEWSVMAKQVES
jgi:hypothetical protein